MLKFLLVRDEESKSVTDCLRHYCQLFLFCVISAILLIPFIYVLSLLPFSNVPFSDQTVDESKETFNPAAILISFITATTMFGPVYLGFAIFIMIGKSMFRTTFVYSLVFHTFFWPVFYTILFAMEFRFWYYYIDFMWFAFAFLPISLHAGYTCLWPSEDDQSHPNNLARTDSFKGKWMEKYCSCISPRMRLTIMFAASELFVIVSALGYTFFLFPLYNQLESDVFRALWRVLLHPIWFEMTMILPQRLIALRELRYIGPYRFIPVMHSLFHTATIGRMLLNNISDISINISVTILSNLTEVLLRLTAYKRDFIAFRFIFGNNENIGELGQMHATVLNAEMIMELLSILTSPFMMYFFSDYGYLFSWYGGFMSIGMLFITQFIQLLSEILTDMICVYYECQRFPLFRVWNQARKFPFLVFLFYGFASMSILGMIYVCTLVPRSLFCSNSLSYYSCTFATVE